MGNRKKWLLPILLLLLLGVVTGIYYYSREEKGPADKEADKEADKKAASGGISDSDNLAEAGYNLVWGDEFDGPELNMDNWNYECREPGWANNELQEYTDSKDNICQKRCGLWGDYLSGPF